MSKKLRASGASFNSLPLAVEDLKERGFKPVLENPRIWKAVKDQRVLTATITFTDLRKKVIVTIS